MKPASTIALFTTACLGLTLIVYLILSFAAERTIARNAERVATGWADYLAEELDGLAAIAAGRPPGLGEQQFLQGVRMMGDVYRFKLFDLSGRLMLVSDDLEMDGVSIGLGARDYTAQSALKRMAPQTRIHDGSGGRDSPMIYTEIYAPVRKAGRAVAVVKVYVDQSRAGAAIRADYFQIGLWVAGLTLIGFSLPATGLIFALRTLGRRNRELGAERDRAISADLAKRQFLAVVSHELRTPLNGVLGFANLLLQSDLAPKTREYVEVIQEAGRSLLLLLNDLLDFSKIEAGSLELEAELFSMEDVVENVVALMRSAAIERGLELSVYIDPAATVRLRGDTNRVRQIITNLVGNAIKFTEKGGVLVEVIAPKGAEDGSGGQPLRISVSDTGVGVPPDQLERIFDRFAQVDESSDRRFKGTGLGLAISRKLARKMGGDVTARNRPGGGAVFTTELVLEVSGDSTAAASSDGDLRTKRALVVDRCEFARSALRRHLMQMGVSVVEMVGDDDAAAYLKACADDLSLPDIAFVATLAEDMQTNPLLQLIEDDLTHQGLRLALCSPMGEAETARPGVEVLEKPLFRRNLSEAIQRMFRSTPDNENGRSTIARSDHAQRKWEGPRARILVADDNRVNQQLVSAILTEVGYAVDTVADGAEAVEIAATLPFDLVLMDIRMPEMDGIEATQRIRALRGPASQVPIIALTANVLPDDVASYIEAGVDDVVEKPFKRNMLLAHIDAALDQVRAEAEAEPNVA